MATRSTFDRRCLVSAAGTLATVLTGHASTSAKKRRKRKRCKGPCTHGNCLAYVEDRFGSPGSAYELGLYHAAQQCCDVYALTRTGKSYRNAVMACFES